MRLGGSGIGSRKASTGTNIGRGCCTCRTSPPLRPSTTRMGIMPHAPRIPDRTAPILGIDIGGTKLAVALATPHGTVLGEARQPSDAASGPDGMIAAVNEMARRVVDEAGMELDEVDRVGIACGGPLDPWRGVVRNALNNPGWIEVPLVARIEAALGRPAYLDNDANAAALGEHRFGAGRGVPDLVY